MKQTVFHLNDACLAPVQGGFKRVKEAQENLILQLVVSWRRPPYFCFVFKNLVKDIEICKEFLKKS